MTRMDSNGKENGENGENNWGNVYYSLEQKWKTINIVSIIMATGTVLFAIALARWYLPLTVAPGENTVVENRVLTDTKLQWIFSAAIGLSGFAAVSATVFGFIERRTKNGIIKKSGLKTKELQDIIEAQCVVIKDHEVTIEQLSVQDAGSKTARNDGRVEPPRESDMKGPHKNPNTKNRKEQQ